MSSCFQVPKTLSRATFRHFTYGRDTDARKRQGDQSGKRAGPPARELSPAKRPAFREIGVRPERETTSRQMGTIGGGSQVLPRPRKTFGNRQPPLTDDQPPTKQARATGQCDQPVEPAAPIRGRTGCHHVEAMLPSMTRPTHEKAASAPASAGPYPEHRRSRRCHRHLPCQPGQVMQTGMNAAFHRRHSRGRLLCKPATR